MKKDKSRIRTDLFPWTTPEEAAKIVLTEEASKVLKSINVEWFEPYGQTAPPYIVKQLSTATTPDDYRNVRQSAHVAHLSMRIDGVIKTEADKARAAMPEEVKAHLRELRESKKGVIRDDPPKAKIIKQEKKKDVKPKVHKSGLPIYQDKVRQNELVLKYPWAVAGSFTHDPHKPGGTCLNIKCIKCGKLRSIHAADLFQCKICLECKNK